MKKNGSTNANASVPKNTAMKMLNMPFWRILGANLNNLLAVLNRSLIRAFKLDVGLDELNRAIGTRGHGLS